MRRFVVLPFAVAVAAALTACSGGGSVLSTGGSTPSNIIITDANQSGNNNQNGLSVRYASASSTQPLRLHAQGVNGASNGTTNSVYTWGAVGPVNSAVWRNGSVASPVNCNAAGTLAGGASSGTTLSIVPNPQTATPTNPAVFTGYALPASAIQVDPQDTAYATFTPPAPAPAPPGFSYFSTTYCAVVTASSGGTSGSVVVLVTP